MTPQSSITMVAEGRRRMSPSWAYNWIRFTTSIPSTTSPVNTASTFSDDTTGAMSGVFSGTLSVIRELTERYVPPIKPRCSSGCNKILCKEMRGQQRCCDCDYDYICMCHLTWDEFVLGPRFAIERIPGLSCRRVKFSSVVVNMLVRLCERSMEADSEWAPAKYCP